MSRRSLFLMLAAGLLVCGLGATGAKAGNVLVHEDEGTYNFDLTSDGKGHVSITYSLVSLTAINGAAIPSGPIAATFSGDALTVTSATTTTLASLGAVTSFAFSEIPPGTNTFGTGAGAVTVATVSDSITSGATSPISGQFLNLVGSITGAPTTLLDTTAALPTIYDFSPFKAGGDLTLSFTAAGANFAAVILHGGTISGTGGFTQLDAVPEPTSMALLGIGMTSFFVFRRFLRRKSISW